MNRKLDDAELLAWFVLAAHRCLLRRETIESQVTHDHRLDEYLGRMASWSASYQPGERVIAASHEFYEICGEFKLFGIVGGVGDASTGVGANRSSGPSADQHRRALEVGHRLAEKFRGAT